MYIMQGISETHHVSTTSGLIRAIRGKDQGANYLHEWHISIVFNMVAEQGSMERSSGWAPCNNNKQASAGMESINKHNQWQRNKWGQCISTESPHQHTPATTANLKNGSIDSQHMPGCRAHQCSIPKTASPSRSITTNNHRSTPDRWSSINSRRTTMDKIGSRTRVHLNFNNQSSSSNNNSSNSNSLPTNGYQRQRLWDMEANPSKVLHPSWGKKHMQGKGYNSS